MREMSKTGEDSIFANRDTLIIHLSQRSLFDPRYPSSTWRTPPDCRGSPR